MAKREDDLLCRYGGEEFVLILGETNLDDAIAIAENCNRYVSSQAFATSAGDIPVTVSLGVAQLPTSPIAADAAHALLESADQQLYRAKESGRNRVCA